MKKTKLMFSAAALLTGLGGAIAANIRDASEGVKYDWMDWNSEIIIANATQAQAQYLCSSASTICLRATANVFIYTTGNLPWQERAEKPKPTATDSQGFETRPDSK